MRDASVGLLAIVAAISAAPVISFGCAPQTVRCDARFAKLETKLSSSSAPIQTQSEELPPKDDTFGPLSILRELSVAPDVPANANRYDTFGIETGGIWRSRVLGFLPSTVIAAQLGTKWMTKEEAAGNIYSTWPKSVVQILGPKAFSSMGTQVEAHATARGAFDEALSPQAIVSLMPIIEASLTKRIRRLEDFAMSGQEVAMADEISGFTLEVIVGGFFGDYATTTVIEDIRRLLPVVVSGLFSIPRRFPWPLNRVPAFGFGRSLEARKAFIGVLTDVLRERRADLASTEGATGGGKSAGFLDSLLEIQQQQIDSGGPKKGKFSFDDDFILDNVLASFFAGLDTTATSLLRILQLLGSTDGKKVVDELVQELNAAVTTNEGTETRSAAAASRDIFKEFPLLDAVVLESARLHPVVAGVFRKAVKDMSYNGYLIPAGRSILWNLIHGFRAESLYPQPTKFCPFRFLHGDKATDGQVTTSGGNATPIGVEQPRPQMFGFGKHMCPGRNLAKLEILLFLRAFLTKFDYELVEGQSFKGVLPANAPKDNLLVVLKVKHAA